MEQQITRNIKFIEKKCVMKPMDGETGLTETWNTHPGVDNPKNVYIKHQGTTYYLVSSKE
jgi:hypothetical protein